MSLGTLKKSVKKTIEFASLMAKGNKIRFRIGSREYALDGLHEDQLSFSEKHEVWLNEAFRAALMSKQGVFIDVGANTGQTLIKLLSFDNTREYIGFEPQIDCSYFVSEFIKQNDLGLHSIIPIGLSNENRMIGLLKRRSTVDRTASTVDGFRPDHFYSAKDYVSVARADDVIPQITQSDIAVLKIDVEGGELEVVEGSRTLLQEHKPFVLFEVLNYYLGATKEVLDDETKRFREERNIKLESILREAGYKIFHILPDKGIDEIATIQPKVSSDLNITDYIAVHADSVETFLDNFKGTIHNA